MNTKIKWVKPKLIELGNALYTFGDCANGEVVTNYCSDGSSVVPGCRDGGIPTAMRT